jgi:hypothetical protein
VGKAADAFLDRRGEDRRRRARPVSRNRADVTGQFDTGYTRGSESTL